VLETDQDHVGAARNHYTAAVNLFSTNAFFHYNLGRFSERQGDDAAALDSWLTAVMLDPYCAPAYDALGTVYWRLEEPYKARARSALDRGLRVAQAVQRLEEQTDCQQPSGLAPVLMSLYTTRAEVARQEGKLEEAKDYGEQARDWLAEGVKQGLSLEPQRVVAVLYHLAEVYALQNDAAQVCKVLLQLQAAGPPVLLQVLAPRAAQLAQHYQCDMPS
jgi:tetratricopeptide (TPR) repeat protein